MYLSKTMRRVFSLFVALVLMIGLLPTGAMAAGESVVVIAASDYQLSNSGTIMTNIMNQIKNDYGSAYGALLGGDYDAGSVSTKASHIEAVDDTISGVFPEMDANNRVYIQGNHENYAGLKPSSSNLLTTERIRDTAYYGVYAINHDDFPWTTSSNPSPSESLVQGTADALGDYLEAKIAAGYTKPIFVMSHLPLHATTRGDNRYASLIFDELEAAGEAGLNIIFLVGHNHSGGYDQYLGNGSFYLPVGSSLTVVKGTSGTYTDSSISFTYMNYGYLGKITGSACTHQTMTAFEITGDQVTVKCYDESGLHKLKAAGVAVSGYNTDTRVIDTEGAVIELGEPEPVETVTDGNVSVSAPGLTGLSVTKTQSTADGKHDAEVYSAYATYEIVPEGYEKGKTATVSITLDQEDGFDAAKAVYLIDAEKGTEKKLTITNGTVTFSTNHLGVYSIVQKVTKTGSYELATSIEAGESYVIVANDHPVALTDNNGTLGSLEVTISGDILTSEEELTEWTFSGATSGTITSSNGNKLGYSSSSWNLTGSGDCSFDIATGSGNFSLRVIRASSGYNRYYFSYDGSGWTSKPTSAAYVRLYRLAEGGSTVEPEEPETPTVPENPELPEEGQWIALPAGNTYVLDSDGIDSGAKYLIVANSYEKALTAASSSGNASDISIDGETATADAGYGWTVTASGSGYTIQNNGTYLGRSNTSLASGSSSSTWTVSNQGSGKYNVTQSGGSSWWGSSSSYYVRWSNSNGYFQASNYNTDPVRLYRYTGAGTGIGANYIRLSGETEQTYTIADAATLDTVLGKIVIQTSDDGTTANTETLAVTSDMVSWETAFDGKTAGIYTGTVVCEGYTLGTITVTINAEHDFETITVEATCTTDGSVTTRCTICGEETVEVIPALGHKNETVTVEATCTKDGSVTTKCTVCGEETVEVIPATGHDYKCVETGATCGQDGSKVFTCGNCADTYTEVIPATGAHAYSSVTVNATCTEAGSVTYTCKTCGHSYVEAIAALGHSYESATIAPTCTDKGYTTYTCATCNHSYTDGITDALGHSYSSFVTATCETSGYVVYTCDTCGHSYNGEVVPAYGHSYETTTVAPTCATAGYTTYICSSCGHTYTGNEIAALGHDYDTAITEATCTENGYTTYTCDTCGHSYVADEVLALGHDYESVITAPTFETEGYTTHTCKVCGDVKVDSYVPVLKHTYETVTVDATCETDGYVTHTCVTCGYSYTETLPALGHAYTTVTTEATCTVNGSIVSTCATCGNVVSEVIKATGHDFDVTTIDPTCTDKGFTTYTCGCGYVETTEIAALGHQYTSKYTAPTCTEAGGTTYTCAVCGHTYTDVEAALGHSYEAKSVAPTCTDRGYTTYTCTTCGDSYTGNEVAALGHSNTTVVTEPTCTDKGYTTYTCSVCGHTSTGNEVAALGHAYSTQESNGNLVHTCDRCGHSYSEKLEMTYTKVSSIQGDNNYVITLVSGNKYYAVSHKDNKISTTRITVSNNEITSDITEDLVWTYSNNKLSYEDGDTTYYLYAQSAGGWWGWWGTPTLTLRTTSSSDVSFSSSKFKVGSYYLRYSGSTVSLNRSATTTYCFVEE